MVALSFKLPDTIVTSLRALAKQKKVSQTHIIEASLIEWIEKEKQKWIEEAFKQYLAQINENFELVSEEQFLTHSASNDGGVLLEKEHA